MNIWNYEYNCKGYYKTVIIPRTNTHAHKFSFPVKFHILLGVWVSRKKRDTFSCAYY